MATKPMQNPVVRYSVIVIVCIIFGKVLFGQRSLHSFRSTSQSYSLSYFTSQGSSSGLDESFLPAGPELDALCGHYRWPPFADRTRRRRVYALMPVNTELDWLEIRLGEMSANVDYFVILESELTFSGLEKPLYVQDNWSRYAAYYDKMILRTLNTTRPDGSSPEGAWDKDRFTRNAVFEQIFPLLTGEQKAWPGDVLITSDVDELIRPEVLVALRNCDFPKRTRLYTTIYYFSFQWISEGVGHGLWDHPDATYFDGFKNTVLPQDLRQNPTESEVWNAGWHCSFCFHSLADIITKVKSYAHQEYNSPEFIDAKLLLNKVRTGEDTFGRSVLHRIDGNRDVPAFLLLPENKQRFGYVLDRDGEDGGFEDWWDLVGEKEGQARNARSKRDIAS